MVERKQISTRKLTLDNTQSRSSGWSGDDDDRRLVESIKNTGVMTAILVRPVSDASFEPSDDDVEYTIIAGSRRFHAAIEAGKVEVPCKIISAGDVEAARLSYKENEERKDLTLTEKAQSIRLQFELMRPDPLDEDEKASCPVCGNGFDTFDGLNKHFGHKHSDGQEGSEDATIPALTPAAAKRRIAKEHFGEYEDPSNAVNNEVNPLLDLAKMPSEVRALYKQPGRRTEDEMELLDERGIDSDRVLGSSIRKTGAAAKEVLELHNEVSEYDNVNPAEVVLDTVASVDVEELEQGSRELGAEISEITDEISERMSDSEIRAEANEVISDTINRREQHLHAQSEKVNGNISTEMRFEFDDNRYSV